MLMLDTCMATNEACIVTALHMLEAREYRQPSRTLRKVILMESMRIAV